MNWRDLRKELFESAPKPRMSNTFQHEDIFNSKKPSIVYVDDVGRSSYRTPKRIRENDTTRSQVLNKSDVKSEGPTKSSGIKTFKSAKTTLQQQEQILKQPSVHKIKDHGDDYFFSIQEEDFKKQLKCQVSQTSPRKSEYPEVSSHKIRKQQEILGNEVGSFILNPNHLESEKIKLDFKSSSQCDITNQQLMEYQNASCREKRLLHNESNIFQLDSYQKKVSIPLQKSPKKKEVQYEVPKNIMQSQLEFDPTLINQIKRKNHNFSDVFGLEYGSREAIQRQKSQQRALSPKLNWTEVDTIKHQKDLGSLNKPMMANSRNKLMEQKSSNDTHSNYENFQAKPMNKETRITYQNEQLNRNINMIRSKGIIRK